MKSTSLQDKYRCSQDLTHLQNFITTNTTTSNIKYLNISQKKCRKVSGFLIGVNLMKKT